MSTATVESVQTQFLLGSFARSLRARNLSPRTVDTYTESVRQFTDFLTRQGMPIRPITPYRTLVALGPARPRAALFPWSLPCLERAVQLQLQCNIVEYKIHVFSRPSAQVGVHFGGEVLPDCEYPVKCSLETFDLV